jgi:tripeptidyl-peptidase II
VQQSEKYFDTPPPFPPPLQVDPGAPGLQTTPSGAPKVVDLVDATGSGDVECSVVLQVEPGHLNLRGASGRLIQLNPAWSNPSGTYFLGTKRGFDLFSSPLAKRVQTARERRRVAAQQQLLEAALRHRQEWEAAHPGKPGTLAVDVRQEGEELKARVEALAELSKRLSGEYWDTCSSQGSWGSQ